ncbi:hypothetical protein CONCODRAFT_18237 [Conidiobolus coronatus NRRL 28638]|uniref:dUTPase-like domain-containing protein n=1 Tax=Conidiobolus coronatus (strain ATCC 28846 / CBS 209.66 / NRRL 28638) TaxID=796925 RepID=A0A137P3I7_CONC2|nr:hypothetical protein CONCODRAFT_18237 [Conidiobolus coronatus NRRL 28638]|eukprot:KXN69582.1 hypothetical protein CONCODRAFT_18237 [Conidiobolus coronatus NRRL 28638]
MTIFTAPITWISYTILYSYVFSEPIVVHDVEITLLCQLIHTVIFALTAITNDPFYTYVGGYTAKLSFAYTTASETFSKNCLRNKNNISIIILGRELIHCPTLVLPSNSYGLLLSTNNLGHLKVKVDFSNNILKLPNGDPPFNWSPLNKQQTTIAYIPLNYQGPAPHPVTLEAHQLLKFETGITLGIPSGLMGIIPRNYANIAVLVVNNTKHTIEIPPNQRVVSIQFVETADVQFERVLTIPNAFTAENTGNLPELPETNYHYLDTARRLLLGIIFNNLLITPYTERN